MSFEGICCCWKLFTFIPFLSFTFPSSFTFVCSSRCRFHVVLARMFLASSKEIGKVSFAASAPVLPVALVRGMIITQTPVAVSRHFNLPVQVNLSWSFEEYCSRRERDLILWLRYLFPQVCSVLLHTTLSYVQGRWITEGNGKLPGFGVFEIPCSRDRQGSRRLRPSWLELSSLWSQSSCSHCLTILL